MLIQLKLCRRILFVLRMPRHNSNGGRPRPVGEVVFLNALSPDFVISTKRSARRNLGVAARQGSRFNQPRAAHGGILSFTATLSFEMTRL
jgi:hypothetical protein